MQTADLTLFFLPLNNYSFAASRGYFINCPNLSLHHPFHNWVFLLLIFISECAFMRVVLSQHPSVTRVMPLSAQTQLFLNSMILPNFCISAQTSSTGVRSKLYSVKHVRSFQRVEPKFIYCVCIWQTQSNFNMYIHVYIKVKKDIFPVQAGVQCRRQLGNRAIALTQSVCTYTQAKHLAEQLFLWLCKVPCYTKQEIEQSPTSFGLTAAFNCSNLPIRIYGLFHMTWVDGLKQSKKPQTDKENKTYNKNPDVNLAQNYVQKLLVCSFW